jgi:YVTN family beta-propeller protein
MKRAPVLLMMLTACFSGVCAAAQLLVLNKGDATLAFIDPASGKTTATVPTGEGPHEVELSSDGRLAFVSNYGAQVPGNTLSVIDVATRKEVKRVDLGDLRRPHGLSFSHGYLYFTSELSHKIARLDPAALRVDWTFETKQDGTHMVLASRDGKQLYTSNIGSNSVGIIEHGTGDQWSQTLVSVGKGPEGLDLSPDGRELWSAHSGDGHISIIDPAHGKVVQTIDARTRRSNRVKFSSDGKLALVSDLSGGELVIFDAAKRAEIKRLTLGRSPTGILIPPGGTTAYVAVSGDNHVAVIDLTSLSIARAIEAGNGPDGMAWLR